MQSLRAEFWLSILFLLVIVAIYIWDAYQLTTGHPPRSVSVVMREWSSAQPILPFCVGVLVGHLFW